MNNGQPFNLGLRLQTESVGSVTILDYDISTDTLNNPVFSDAVAFEAAAMDMLHKQVRAVSARVFAEPVVPR